MTTELIAKALCRASLPEQSVWFVGDLTQAICVPESWTVRLRDLRDHPSGPAQILALCSLAPSDLPALQSIAPAMIALVGQDFDPTLIEALQEKLPQSALLGPGACLHVDPQAQGVQLAIDAAQLCNARHRRLALAPTPDWLLPGLLDVVDEGVLGWVRTDRLSPQWQELHSEISPPLICAICPETPTSQAQPWSKGLEAIALAQDLGAPLGLREILDTETMDLLAQLGPSYDPSQGTQTAVDSASPAMSPENWELLHLAESRLHGLIQPPALPSSSPLRKIPPKQALQIQRVQASVQRYLELADWEPDAGFPGDEERSREVLYAAAEGLTDHESKVVLKGWGFEVTRQAVGKSASAALSYAQKIGYPVALKAISPTLRQKSAAQCVELNVANASALKRHYQKLNDRAIEKVGEDQLDGVLVSEMMPEGLDVQLRLLRGASGAWVLYARCLSSEAASISPGRDPGIWGFLPRTAPQALRFADRVIPHEHPDQAAATECLAQEILRFVDPLHELKDRLFCIELDPLRIWPAGDGPAPATVLDAYIEQDAHIHGA